MNLFKVIYICDIKWYTYVELPTHTWKSPARSSMDFFYPLLGRMDNEMYFEED